MLGRTDIDNFVHYNDFMNLVHPDDKEHAMQAMADHLEGRKEYYETAYRIQYSDGTYKVFMIAGELPAVKAKKLLLPVL